MEAFPGSSFGRLASFGEISMIDWEGKAAALVFVSGCPWRCPWCHNPSLLKTEASESVSGLMEYLAKKKKWIDGVVVTGGEPLYGDDITLLLGEIKDAGFSVKIDTNGSNPALLKEILESGLADYAAMDIKSALRKEDYDRATGVSGSLEGVKRSVDILSRLPRDIYEFRTTLIEGVAEEEEVLYNAEKLPAGSLWALQPFISEKAAAESLRGIPPFSEKRVKALARKLRDKGFRIRN